MAIVLTSLASVVFVGSFVNHRVQITAEARDARDNCRVICDEAIDAAKLASLKAPMAGKPPRPRPPVWDRGAPSLAGHLRQPDFVIVRIAFET